MNVLICEAPGLLSLAERPRPVRRSGEVLIRIRRVGMCGTDYHILRGTQPYLTYPRVMGHEISGEVVETNPGSPFHAGQSVCVIPYISCGRCRACLRGRSNCCREMRVLGVHCDGGLAEFVSIPEQFVIDATGLSLDQAAMVEFLSVGHHAVSRGDVMKGDKVLIVGVGAIGMAITLFAVQRGAEVTVTDPNDSRADFCVRVLGAERAIPRGNQTAALMSELTGGEGYDVVFDATGDPGAMEAGFAHVAHGGRYVLVSIVSADIRFNDPEFHKRETTLLASRNATIDDFAAVIAAIRNGDLPTQELHTHSAPLEDLGAVIRDWATPDAGVIKALVELN